MARSSGSTSREAHGSSRNHSTSRWASSTCNAMMPVSAMVAVLRSSPSANADKGVAVPRTVSSAGAFTRLARGTAAEACANVGSPLAVPPT